MSKKVYGHKKEISIICFQGIEWVQIDYFNNKTICDLIEKVVPLSELVTTPYLETFGHYIVDG